jgi:hypothetical protein
MIKAAALLLALSTASALAQTAAPYLGGGHVVDDSQWTTCVRGRTGETRACRLYAIGPEGANWDWCILTDGRRFRCRHPHE